MYNYTDHVETWGKCLWQHQIRTVGWHPVLVQILFALQSIPHSLVPSSVSPGLTPDAPGPTSGCIWQDLKSSRNSQENRGGERGKARAILSSRPFCRAWAFQKQLHLFYTGPLVTPTLTPGNITSSLCPHSLKVAVLSATKSRSPHLATFGFSTPIPPCVTKSCIQVSSW